MILKANGKLKNCGIISTKVLTIQDPVKDTDNYDGLKKILEYSTLI
jgi:hypothetical protein